MMEHNKLHEWSIVMTSERSIISIETVIEQFQKEGRKYPPGPVTWTVSDLAKACNVLAVPSVKVLFDNREEKKRVYTLIYNVLQFKNLLSPILDDVFFSQFPMFVKKTLQVYVLCYDLYHRAFRKREESERDNAQELLKAFGLDGVDVALWVSRLNIAVSIEKSIYLFNALVLSEMLIQQTKDWRAVEIARKSPIYCWTNYELCEDRRSLFNEIRKELKVRLVPHFRQLRKKQFKCNLDCPHMIAFHHSLGLRLDTCSLVENDKLVILDRAFCLGPATFAKLLLNLELQGSVIQTHVSSPKTTAYLAFLLSENKRITQLLVFSAGRRKLQYESYFQRMGIKNIRVFYHSLIDSSRDAPYLKEAIAVLATPPNGNSAILDPIDLVANRNGKLSMLEVITEFDKTDQMKERMVKLLDEQRKTLRFAVTLPQVQFVLYETHSRLEVENYGMVKDVLSENNRIAKLLHATLQGKLSRAVFDGIQSASRGSYESELGREAESRNINVPDRDIFYMSSLPQLSPADSSRLNFQTGQCYLALLQRRKMLSLDDKIAVQIDDPRSRFGSNRVSTLKSTKVRALNKQAQIAARKKQEEDWEHLFVRGSQAIIWPAPEPSELVDVDFDAEEEVQCYYRGVFVNGIQYRNNGNDVQTDLDQPIEENKEDRDYISLGVTYGIIDVTFGEMGDETSGDIISDLNQEIGEEVPLGRLIEETAGIVGHAIGIIQESVLMFERAVVSVEDIYDSVRDASNEIFRLFD